jgi:hypothetical protein
MTESSYGTPGGEAQRKYEKLSKDLADRHKARTPLKKFLVTVLNVDAEEERRAESWRKWLVGEQEAN